MIRGSVSVAALVLLGRGVAAQEPALVTTAQVQALRQAQRSNDPLLAARQATIEAARLRLGAVARRGPLDLSFELEEFRVTDPLNQTVRIAAAHEFVPAAAVSAVSARRLAQLELEEARLAGAALVAGIDLDRHVIEASVWQRIRARLLEEDSLLVRAGATLNARFAAGDARYIDVIRLRTERIRVQSEAIDALALAQSARLRLVGLVGDDAAEIVDAAVASVRELRIPTLPAARDLIASAPAIQLAAAEVTIARADLGSTRAESLRRWTAGVGLQRFEAGTGYTIGPVLMGSVSLPTPQRAVRNALAQAAAQDTVSASRTHRAAISRLRADVAGAEARFNAARQRYESSDARLLAAAREERESALVAYATGELSLIELLDFERALARAETQRLESYLRMVDAWADIWRAAATGEHQENER